MYYPRPDKDIARWHGPTKQRHALSYFLRSQPQWFKVTVIYIPIYQGAFADATDAISAAIGQVHTIMHSRLQNAFTRLSLKKPAVGFYDHFETHR